MAIVFLTFANISLKAHNPNTASAVISRINGVWLVELKISQEGADYALEKHTGALSIHTIGTQRIQATLFGLCYSKNKD